jgi:hypothetical protein
VNATLVKELTRIAYEIGNNLLTAGIEKRKRLEMTNALTESSQPESTIKTCAQQAEKSKEPLHDQKRKVVVKVESPEACRRA